MATSTSAFIPAIWTEQIQRTLEKNLVAKNICSTEAEGKIKKAGDTVHFMGMADPSINDYTDNSTNISYENLVTSDLALVIDQQKYFSFQVSDIEKAQSNVEMQNSQATRAGYMLRDVVDQFIFGKYTDAGIRIDKTTSSGTTTAANSILHIGEISQKLDEANVSRENQFIVIPPWLKMKLRYAGIKFSVKEGAKISDGVEWTDELGFDMYVSNNLSGSVASGIHTNYIMAGSKNAIAFAQQVNETECIRLEQKFSNGVRGLLVYGGKVIRPAELVSCKMTEGTDTSL